MNSELPVGDAPEAINFTHFPSRVHATIWRNWGIVAVEKIAEILETNEENITKIASGMGLSVPSQVDDKWLERGYVTIIRRNWHLLTYEQILKLLEWSEDKLLYVLKEDDFLFYKLGQHKPFVGKNTFSEIAERENKHAITIAEVLKKHFPEGFETAENHKPFSFLSIKSETGNIAQKKIRSITKEEIALDNSWWVQYSTKDDRINFYTQRFINELSNRWGVRLNPDPDQDVNDKVISLAVIPDGEKTRESHSIDITDGEIRITAVDEIGVLRGLQFIQNEMESNEGPYLKKARINRNTRFSLRLIYSYSAVYGDPFTDSDLDPYPDEWLNKLSSMGINGIWMQGVLYDFVSWDRTPDLSSERIKRIEGLNNIVKRAADYGIGVYLYINEPRAMPLRFFENNMDIKGHEEGGYASLCTSQKAVQEYIRDGFRILFTEVPQLAGIITITMSENLTNCYSHSTKKSINCPVCSKRTPQEVVSEVNRLIAEGVWSAKPDAEVICWNWGWNKSFEWDDKMIKEAIGLLPEGVRLMCTSEDEMPYNIAGIEGQIQDYSMSIVGPGQKSTACWKQASEKGLTALAKIQVNNTWECSAVPYLPVMNLVDQHMKNLTAEGVSGLMLGWTLGGYPSINMEFASQYYWDDHKDFKNIDVCEFALKKFGEIVGPKVYAAWTLFSSAFREFPFHLMVLYTAPQNFGPANLLFYENSNRKATMLGFPYDDLETWRGIYPEEILENQFEKLSIGWANGLIALKSAEINVAVKNSGLLRDMMSVAATVHCHFRSTYLQIAFIRLRNKLYMEDNENREKIIKEIIEIIDEEIHLAKELYKIVSTDSRIGFEASNQYFYTGQDLKEKVVNCEYLKYRFLNGSNSEWRMCNDTI